MKKIRYIQKLIVIMTVLFFMTNNAFAEWDTTTIPGEISTPDNVTIGGTLDVTGSIGTSDSASIDGSLTVTGPVTASNGALITKDLEVEDGGIILPVDRNIQFGNDTTGIDAYIGFSDHYPGFKRLIMSNFAYVDESGDGGLGFSVNNTGSGIDIYGQHIYFRSIIGGTIYTNASINGENGHFTIFNDLDVNGSIAVNGDISSESIDVQNDMLNFTGRDVVISQKLGIGTGTAAPQSELDVAGTMTAKSIDVGSGTYKILEPGTELTSALLNHEGTTFILPPGDYNLSVGGVWLNNNKISIIGFEGTKIIKSEHHGRIVLQGDNCQLQNFAFDRNGKQGYNIEITGNNNKSDQINMYDNSVTVDDGCGFHVKDTSGTWITNCVVTGNPTGAIRVLNSKDAYIAGNLVKENGINDIDDVADGISLLTGSENCKVTGNHIINNSNNGIGLSYASGNIVTDNIVEHHSNGSGIVLASPDVTSISHHNIISNNYITSNGKYGIDFYSQFPDQDNENMVIGNICNNNTLEAMRIADISDNKIAFNKGKDTDFDVKGSMTINGNVGIGTSAPQSELAVNGTITAKEVIVNDTLFADYVFEDNYELRTLDAVEAYIKENKHLPGVPSAETVKKDGMAMSEIVVKQMEKIEELTLYLIDMKKTNDELLNRVSVLEAQR